MLRCLTNYTMFPVMFLQKYSKKALEFLEAEIVRKNKRGLKAGDPTVRQEAKAQLEAILTKGGGNAADFYSGLERFTKVKKDFLQGRKKIPEPIRDLLGEIDNPLARWQKSTSKLINVIADTKFHDDMFEARSWSLFLC